MRLGSVFVLAVSDAAADPSPPPPTADQIAEAVRHLGERDFSTRDKAQKQIEAWGSENPEAVLEAVSKKSDDAETESRCVEVRRILSLPPVQRKLVLSVAGNPSLRGALDTLFRSD